MKKTIITILIGFILAFAGGFGALTYIQYVLQPVKIYEAKKTIERGQQIKEEDIKEITYYKGNMGKSGYITDRKKIVGMFAKYDFAQGDQFKISKLSNTFDVTSIYKEVLQDGEVAIGVKTDLEKAIGGIVKKGDFVNIIARNKSDVQPFNKAKTILQHVEVLHIANKQGDSLAQDGEESKDNMQYADKSPEVVVVKVRQEDEALVAVHQEVTLSLNSKNYKNYDAKEIKNTFDGGNSVNMNATIKDKNGTTEINAVIGGQ